ncbi:MAG: 50S ribosomal protein L22 [Patescibacteria group bacterium]
MTIQAEARLNGLHISDKKVRLVVDLVRGLPIEQAYAQLSAMNKAARKPVMKLIKSAEANAVHNSKADASTLVIHTIQVNKGSMQYRSMPRARGTAAPIRRHSCHVWVTLQGTAPDAQPASSEAVVEAKAE